MFKKIFVLNLVLALFLTGCISSQVTKGDYYTMKTDPTNSEFNIVEMQTYDPESEFFTFMYQPKDWTIEEWEDAPGKVALVNKKYEDRTCYLLPGSIGDDPVEGQQLVAGVLLTTKGRAETLDIYNADGTLLRRIVGYTINGKPYLFELKLPASDADECSQDGQIVNATFDLVRGAEPLEEEPVEEAVVEEPVVVEEEVPAV